MVADSFEEADVRVEDSVEAEFGVEELGRSFGLFANELSMESRGFTGLPKAGAAEAGTS